LYLSEQRNFQTFIIVLSSAGAEVNVLRQKWVWRIKETIIDTLVNQRALCVKGGIQHVVSNPL
jgi:hypothetical protein